MRLTAIALEDFRSYSSATIALAPGLTVFVGPNGAGKTNLLEAVHVVARGDSSRAGDDAEMIRWGASVARVAVETASKDGASRWLEVTLFAPAPEARRRSRRYAADGAPKRADDVLGAVTVVAFFPQDTDLLASAPAARRRYLDAMVAQIDRAHRSDLRAYARVLEQRNALLRAGRDEEPIPESEIAFWDSELVRLVRVAPGLAPGGGPPPRFVRGGGEGGAVPGRKLAEAQGRGAHRGPPPVFLLDDVLSELDTARREALAGALPDDAQALLTAAIPTSLPERMRERATLVPVTLGAVG